MEDLLTPTLQETRTVRGARLPWSMTALLMMSFFGGPLAALIASQVSGRRMQASPQQRLATAAWATAMIGVCCVALVYLLPLDSDAQVLGHFSPQLVARRVSNLTGLLAWVVASRVLRGPGRQHQTRLGGSDPEWASPWLAGVAMAIACPVALALPIAALVQLLEVRP